MRVLLALLACVLVSSAAPASARSLKSFRSNTRKTPPLAFPARGTRVAVQPINGAVGPALRAQVARLLKQRGVRVLTSVPPASGTSQYPGLASEHQVAAFVVADVTEHSHSASVTFLVWQSDGSVAGRWSLWASDKKLARVVAKGFWKQLGRPLSECKAPPSEDLGPAPPMRIDAGSPVDEPIVSDDGWNRNKAPILR